MVVRIKHKPNLDMEISIIRGNLQKLIAVNANRALLTVDLALGLIGTYMLRTVTSGLSDWKAMETFLKYLQSRCFKGNTRSMITESSFSDCALFIQRFLSLQPFEKKRGTLMSFELKVIFEVNDNGYLSFNDRTFNVYASQERIDNNPAIDYIVVDKANNVIENNNVEGPEEGDVDTDTPNAETNTEDNTTNEHEVLTPERHILRVANNTPRKQSHSNGNSPFTQLYDELVSNDPEKRREAQYIWQWFLTMDEYNSIKECLSQYKLPTPGKWDNKTVHLLALYIGEFYKREYDDNNKALFAQFDENSPNFKFRNFDKICNFLNIEPYRRDNQAHLFTLYVNGGLPIHYISTKLDDDKTNSLIDGLSKLLDTEDDIDRIEGEESLERVNTALRGSYQNGHSIYEYIQALLLGKETWNDLDNDSSDFIDFKEKIKEANKKTTERKKFKILYSLWTYLDNSNIKEFYITPQLRFNPEEDGERHYAISKQRLTSWGIKNPPAQFSLIIGENNIIFTICANGDYISRDMVDRIDLPILDKNLKIEDLSNPEYAINYDDLSGESCSLKKDFYHPFKDGFIQFYTDDDPPVFVYSPAHQRRACFSSL